MTDHSAIARAAIAERVSLEFSRKPSEALYMLGAFWPSRLLRAFKAR
jgi:hypothetical protein